MSVAESVGGEPGELIATHTVQLRLPLSIEQRLKARAEAADATVDELVSEWAISRRPRRLPSISATSCPPGLRPAARSWRRVFR
ncbi:hypothetical protein [Nocardia xishanensis]